MAGLTTASLVALEEPLDEPALTLHRPRLARWLGLSESTTSLNAVGLLSSALSTITSLVFLNASQPFLLDYLDVKKGRGSVTGTLLLADELVALIVYFIAGAAADRLGIKSVAVAGHVLVAVALVLYVSVKSVFPALLLSRMLFACGASALVVVLGAGLANMTAATAPTDSHEEVSRSEQTPLLASSSDPDAHAVRPEQSSRFAGILGLATGLGALLAVFVLLPLPTELARWFPAVSIQGGLKITFGLVACLAFLEGIFLFFALQNLDGQGVSKTGPDYEEATIMRAVRDLPLGFKLAIVDGEVLLSFVSSFASRSSATIVTGFIPLLVIHYFTTHSLCDTGEVDPSDPKSCRAAFIWASILSGVVQTISLCFCPLIGFLGSYMTQPAMMLGTASLGAVSFFVLSALRDPRDALIWPCVVGIGIAQAGGIVTSLSLLAVGRSHLVGNHQREIGGALSAAYSFSGGIGILSVGQLSGVLFDRWSGAPFAIIGIVYASVMLCSSLLLWRRARSSPTSSTLQ